MALIDAVLFRIDNRPTNQETGEMVNRITFRHGEGPRTSVDGIAYQAERSIRSIRGEKEQDGNQIRFRMCQERRSHGLGHTTYQFQLDRR